jgi:TM2 domain-containing membrane protein YozV
MATQYVTCPNCHTQNPGINSRCVNCGTAMPVAAAPMQQMPNVGAKPAGADKKVAAGICGIVLGGLGIHKFILGYQQEGIIMLSVYLGGLILGFFTCGITFLLSMAVHVVGIVEGIMYLMKSDEEFVDTYINHKKPWF